MLRVFAENFVHMGIVFEESQMLALPLPTGGLILGGGNRSAEPVDPAALELILRNFAAIKSHCDLLELETSGNLALQAVAKLRDVRPTRAVVAAEMEFLQRAVISELQTRVFMFIPSARARFHRSTRATKETLEKFPVNLLFLSKFPDAV